MMHRFKNVLRHLCLLALGLCWVGTEGAQQGPDRDAHVKISFEGNPTPEGAGDVVAEVVGDFSYRPGLAGNSLHSDGGQANRYIRLAGLDMGFDHADDFTVQVWVKATSGSSQSSVLVSNSDLTRSRQPYNQGRYPHQMMNAGWSLFTRDGTWGFNLGDGNRNYHYQPHEGTQPINDGEWHQLAFSHSSEEVAVRVYFDGQKKALMHLADLRNSIQGQYPVHIGAAVRGEQSDFPPFDGSLDELAIWDRSLTDAEVDELYSAHRPSKVKPLPPTRQSIKVMAWNIWHGGHHYVRDGEGGRIVRGDIWDKPELVNSYDGAVRVAEIIEELGADIVLLQESYGSGPRIASLLDYEIMIATGLFSNQVWGPNITLLSRFPIEQAYVERRFVSNNGGAVIRISEGQHVVAFSNWYPGRRTSELEGVLARWSEVIANSDAVPVFYGGDFNAQSHFNGGETQHSRIMVDAGFTDSFFEKGSGYERRIDFLYYKGSKLAPTTSIMRREEIADYPSDHPLVLTEYDLDAEPPGILGTWKLDSYALRDGRNPRVDGSILFTEKGWAVLFFVVDEDGEPRRGSGEGGTYTLEGDRLTFFHRYNMSGGEAIEGYDASELSLTLREPEAAVSEACTIELTTDRLTIHFPSGNRIEFSRSSR